jgi:PAS domain S-box-containing protein
MNNSQFLNHDSDNSQKSFTLSQDIQQSEKLSQEFLLEMINSISEPIFVKDRQHRWIFANNAYCNLIGHSQAELIGKSDYDLFPPTEAEIFWKKDELIFSTGTNNQSEENFTDASGVNHIISTKKSLFTDGLSTQFLVVIIRDITQHITEAQQLEAKLEKRIEKQTEKALRRSNALLKAQQEASIDGILVVDENLQILSYNQRFLDIWQIPLQLVQTGKQQLIFPTALQQTLNPEQFLSQVQYLYQHPEEISRDEIALKDGRTLDRYTAPVRSPQGDNYGRVWYFQDITERKQALAALEQSTAQLRQQAQELEKTLCELQSAQTQLIQSEKMSSLGLLVAGVAHEINNPLSFIFGNLTYAEEYIKDLLKLLRLYQENYPQPKEEIQNFTQLIEIDFLTTDLLLLLNSMKVGTNRICEIVLSLRTFSRLDEDGMKAVDIHDGLDTTLMILQNRLKANGQRKDIQVIKQYSNLPLVECYPGQLNQVFMNILTNAIDALEESFANNFQSMTDEERQLASLEIRIHTKIISDNQVTIHIADNGPGIPESVQKRIFDPFFTTKPVGKGTGMGLSISYQIVTERHGGSLKFISQPGQGTEFLVTIPLIQKR